MTTHTDFGGQTLGSDVAQEFRDRIHGRVVVITGVSPVSLGGTLAQNIARHGPAKLILASHSVANMREVAQSITSSQAPCTPDIVKVNLASLASIRMAAKTIAELTQEVHLLINTAAVIPSDRRVTEDGFEMQFGVTHLGHFLLTELLMPQLKRASLSSPLAKGSVRVVNISSLSHEMSPFRFTDYNFEGKPTPVEEQPSPEVQKLFRLPSPIQYQVFVAYGQSKTANVLHSVELTRRFFDTDGIRSFALMPGTIETGAPRNLSPTERKALDIGARGKWITPDQGTATILVAALDPALDGTHIENIYLDACQFKQAASHARDERLARRLWELSERLTAGVRESKL